MTVHPVTSWHDRAVGAAKVIADEEILGPGDDADAAALLEAIVSGERALCGSGRPSPWRGAPGAPGRRTSWHGLGQSTLGRKGRLGALLVATAATVALVLGLFGTLGSGTAVRRVGAPGWHLTGYVAGWSSPATSPGLGGLTCPDASTCYATGPEGMATPSARGVSIDALFATHDGGATWSGPSVLPAGMTFTTPLQCVTAVTCLAGGSAASAAGPGTAVLLETSDGGQSWRSTPLPPKSSSLRALSCPSASACFGLISGSSAASTLGFGPFYDGSDARPATFLATTDGGATWSRATLPVRDSIALLDCPTTSSCVAAGEQIATASPGGSAPEGIVLTTSDGGKTWTTARSSTDLSPSTALSCPSASDCFLVGSSSVTVPTPPANYCATPHRACVHPAGPTMTVGLSHFYRSTDGGASWQPEPFPLSVPELDIQHLSCPTSNECWVSGIDAVPETEGPVASGNSPVVLTTGDAGENWTTIPPPVASSTAIPSPTPQELVALQCPGAGDCVGMTWAAQGGARSGQSVNPARVFTYRGSPG